MWSAAEKIRALNLSEVENGFGAESRLGSIRDFWAGLCPPGGLPDRLDIDMPDLRPWLGWVSMVDAPAGEGRFRWRLVGSQIARMMGRDATESWFDELYEKPVLKGYVEKYSVVIERGAPVFWHGDVEFLGREHLRFQMVHLPLRNGGETPELILLCMEELISP